MQSCRETYYDKYNREERALCSHLFLLLHEGLNSDDPSKSFLGLTLKCLDKNLRSRTTPINKQNDILEALAHIDVTQAVIFSEVAVLRDALFQDDDETRITEAKRLLGEYVQALNSEARDGKENKSVWTYQGLISAKPDLILAFPNLLLVFEAKYTTRIDAAQLSRTRDLVRAWGEFPLPSSGYPNSLARTILQDLGVDPTSPIVVLTLSDERDSPDLSWQDLFGVMKECWPTRTDRAQIAFESAIALLASEASTTEPTQFRYDGLVRGMEEVESLLVREPTVYIGYVGGRRALIKKLDEDREYILSRPYKWVRVVKPPLLEKNWLLIDEFFSLVNPDCVG